MFRFLGVKQLLFPKINLDPLDRGGHKTRLKSPLLWPQCNVCKMGILIRLSVVDKRIWVLFMIVKRWKHPNANQLTKGKTICPHNRILCSYRKE